MKNILITGSASGIGFELAKIFHEVGENVYLNNNNIKRLKKASKILGNSKYYLCDVTNQSSIKKAFKKMKKDGVKLDVLICNYGNSLPKNNHLNFEHAFKHNFFSAVNVVEASIKLLKKNAKIICISSICGNEILKGAPLGYSLAKNSLINFVKTYSELLKDKDITINSISPGNIRFKNSMWDKKIKKNPELLDPSNTNKPLVFESVRDIYNVCFYILKMNTFESGSNFLTSVTKGTKPFKNF